MELIKVFLIDDHSLVRMGIKSIFERHDDFLVCGEAGSLEEAYEKVEQLNPDVILLDWKLPDGNGINGCVKLKKILPKSKVLILTAYSDDHVVLDTIKSGADGYLLKNIDRKTIINSVKDVHAGKSVLDSSITGIILNKMSDKSDKTDLSVQERQILDLITIGKTNKEIAKELGLAEKTVRNYVTRIMKKIKVNNRTEAAIYWAKQKT